MFTEEYTKTTKGMYNVYTFLANELALHLSLNLTLNEEHWGRSELVDKFKGIAKVKCIGFRLPGYYLSKKLKIKVDSQHARNFFFILENTINILFFPIIIYLLCRHTKGYDAVISHNGGWPGSPIARWILLAAKITKAKKRIFVIHSHPAPLPRIFSFFFFISRKIEKLLINYSATDIVAVSDSLKSSLESIFTPPIHRIYNGLPVSELSPSDLPARVNYNSTKKVVGYIGALNFNKGLDFLIDAFSHVKIDCELIVAGPGEEAYVNHLKEKVKKSLNPVVFLGYQNDIADFFSKIDFLVMPSVAYESFGMVLLEAMKYKKAVICSNFGGMKEVVVNNETGYVVDVFDTTSLGEKIEFLVENPDVSASMGSKGYQRYINEFSSTKMGREYLSLLGK